MELVLGRLKELIDLPMEDPHALRQILDDLGLEVKGVEEGAELTTFDIETLAHRGDHLHHLGIAREFAGRYLHSLNLPKLASELSDTKLSFRIETTECLRYAAMDMDLPKFSFKSPWKATTNQSEASTERHAIVELLNDVQWEMGLPMHAFDRAKLEGELRIVAAEKEEEIEALDGKTYTVPAGSILIRDSKKTVAVGGVIGCANSMVTTETSRCIIEAAVFQPVRVRKTARAMGISTDASYAFERGVDIEAPPTALRRVAYLVNRALGGTGGALAAHVHSFRDVKGQSFPTPPVLPLFLTRIRSELNLKRLNDVEITSRLKALGYLVKEIDTKKGLFEVTVPSWRIWSVQTEQAVIEDVARIYGLSRVKLSLPTLLPDFPVENPGENFIRRVEPALTGAGFLEVVTKSYYGPQSVTMLEELGFPDDRRHLSLKNALDRSYSQMKLSNIPLFLELISRNLRQGVSSIKVYEICRVFGEGAQQQSGEYQFERDVLTFAASGRWNQSSTLQAEKMTLQDLLLAMKGVVLSVGQALGVSFSFQESHNPYLHPGCQAGITIEGTTVGVFGSIHPKLLKDGECREEIAYAELEIEQILPHSKEVGFAKVSDQPPIQRDMTLLLPERFMATSVVNTLLKSKIQFLERVEILGEFVREGETVRRTTFRCTFRDDTKTLQHREVDERMEEVFKKLSSKHRLEVA